MAEANDEEKIDAAFLKAVNTLEELFRRKQGSVGRDLAAYESLIRDCEKLIEESFLLKRKKHREREMRNLEEKKGEEIEEQKESEEIEEQKESEEKMKEVEVLPWSTISFHQFNVGVANDFVATDPEVTIDDSSWPSIDRHLPSTSNVNPDSTLDDPLMVIQKGVRFIREEDDVSVQCLSDKSVFFHSPISNKLLGLPRATVIEIPSGKSLKVFSYKEFARLLNDALDEGYKQGGYQEVRELILTSSIRMSFGGVSWGPGSPNAKVTSTPCWIEMRLRKPMVWLKDILAHIEHLVASPSPKALTPPPGMEKP